ncbi:MAG TPA: hypothetical protein VMT20_12940 [Terriglobia bacterium]|nr:hypothetical protein [Terriglobia bacterium]
MATHGITERERVTTDVADSVISKAQSFVAMAEDFLGAAGGKSESTQS